MLYVQNGKLIQICWGIICFDANLENLASNGMIFLNFIPMILKCVLNRSKPHTLWVQSQENIHIWYHQDVSTNSCNSVYNLSCTLKSWYSRIPLSRAPLTRENQLVARPLGPQILVTCHSRLPTCDMVLPTLVEVSKFLHSRIHRRRHDKPLISVTA